MALSPSARMVACSKLGYPTRNEALLMLALLIARRQKNPCRKERAVYPCSTCPNWHLTTKAPAKWGIRGGHRAFGHP